MLKATTATVNNLVNLLSDGLFFTSACPLARSFDHAIDTCKSELSSHGWESDCVHNVATTCACFITVDTGSAIIQPNWQMVQSALFRAMLDSLIA